MGEVYRAKDLRLNRDVAVKVLLAALSSDSESLPLFSRKRRPAGALNHPKRGQLSGSRADIFNLGVFCTKRYRAKECRLMRLVSCAERDLRYFASVPGAALIES